MMEFSSFQTPENSPTRNSRLPFNDYVWTAPSGEILMGWHHQFIQHTLANTTGWQHGDYLPTHFALSVQGEGFDVSSDVLTAVANEFLQLSADMQTVYRNNIPWFPSATESFVANATFEYPSPQALEDDFERFLAGDQSIFNDDSNDQTNPPVNYFDYQVNQDLMFALDDSYVDAGKDTFPSLSRAESYIAAEILQPDSPPDLSRAELYIASKILPDRPKTPRRATTNRDRNRSRSPRRGIPEAYRQRNPRSRSPRRTPLTKTTMLARVDPATYNFLKPLEDDITADPSKEDDSFFMRGAVAMQQGMLQPQHVLPSTLLPPATPLGPSSAQGKKTSPVRSALKSPSTTRKPRTSKKAVRFAPSPILPLPTKSPNSNTSDSVMTPPSGPAHRGGQGNGYHGSRILAHEADDFIANWKEGDLIPQYIDGYAWYCKQPGCYNGIRGQMTKKTLVIRHYHDVHHITIERVTELPEKLRGRPDANPSIPAASAYAAASQQTFVPILAQIPPAPQFVTRATNVTNPAAQTGGDPQQRSSPSSADSDLAVLDAGAIDDKSQDKDFKSRAGVTKTDDNDDADGKALAPARRSTRISARRRTLR